MFYSNNPDYELKLSHEVGGVKYSLYTPVNVATGYSMQRYVEAQTQNIYSAGGATVEVLRGIAAAGLDICENKPKAAVRTDNAALWHNILYRLQHPVDQDCTIRMAAILSFLEYEKDGTVYSEPVDEIQITWRDKKEQLAKLSDDLYRFFLTWGIAHTEAYKDRLNTLEDQEYFRRRETTIAALMAGFPVLQGT
jgi:hypothetical protein